MTDVVITPVFQHESHLQSALRDWQGFQIDPSPARCISCGDMHTPGDDMIPLEPLDAKGRCDTYQCAWCHRSEHGVWPTGMTMEEEDE